MQQDALFGALPFSEEDGWLPVSSMNGPQNGYPYLARATQLRRSADVANYVKRLDAIPTRLDQMMARMRVGMKSGWMPPKAAMGQVPGMFDAFVMEDVTRSPLWVPFTQLPPDMPPRSATSGTPEGKRAMAGVRAGFAKVQKFLARNTSRRAQRARRLVAARGSGVLRAAVRENDDHASRRRDPPDRPLGSRAHPQGDGRGHRHDGLQGHVPRVPEVHQHRSALHVQDRRARLAAYRDIAKRADAELPKFFAGAAAPALRHPRDGGVRGRQLGPLLARRARRQPRRLLRGQREQPREAPVARDGIDAHARGGAGPSPADRARAGAEGPAALPPLGVVRRLRRGLGALRESLGYEMGFYKDPYMRFGALVARRCAPAASSWTRACTA
jgi:hypothetical protein